MISAGTDAVRLVAVDEGVSMGMEELTVAASSMRADVPAEAPVEAVPFIVVVVEPASIE